MTIPANTSRLIRLMDEHKLTAKEVAQMLGRSAKTVRMWRCVSEPEIPGNLLELLELKLAKAPTQSSLPLEQDVAK